MFEIKESQTKLINNPMPRYPDNLVPDDLISKLPDLCDIDCVPNKARHQAVNIVLNNSQAFVGNSACVALRKYD